MSALVVLVTIQAFGCVTHRVAISDHRHLHLEGLRDASVALMTLSPAEFMRRFLLHVLPDALANPPLRLSCQRHSASKLARIRQRLPPAPQQQVVPVTPDAVTATIAPEGPAVSVTEDL